MTIRDVPARVVKSLKRLASRQNKSMEQQVRDILEQHVAERDSVLKQIEASWARQSRRPETAAKRDSAKFRKNIQAAFAAGRAADKGRGGPAGFCKWAGDR